VGNLVSAPLLLRRWLTRAAGDGPGEVQGAFWLDLKRTYMELRPRLRRNYATTTCPEVYMPVLEPLGGGLIPDGVVELDGRAYHGAFLEFGPSSVDGWLTRIATDELGLPEDDLLDVRRRQLLVDGRRIASTGADVARSAVKPTLRHFAEALLYPRGGRCVPSNPVRHHGHARGPVHPTVPVTPQPVPIPAVSGCSCPWQPPAAQAQTADSHQPSAPHHHAVTTTA
jgi:hypothetical protein